MSLHAQGCYRAATAQEEVVSLTGTAWHEWWRRACALFREAGFDAISPAHRAFAERAGSRDC